MSIAITGLGCIGPLGFGTEQTWSNALAGKSCVVNLPSDYPEMPTRLYAPIDDGVMNDALLQTNIIEKPKKFMRQADDYITFSVLAAEQAINDANFMSSYSANGVAVVVGSAIGGLPFIEDNILKMAMKGPRKMSPFFVPGGLPNMPAGYISQLWGLNGPNMAPTTACASGAHSICMGAMLLQTGMADVVIAGGTECIRCHASHGGFGALRALSTHEEPEKASRPWDQNRDGFIIGEGAGIIVMERQADAQKRGANILGVLAGYGMTSDGYHITTPDPEATQHERVMRIAIKQAGISPQDVGYINAHATSTQAGDMSEPRAIERLFGHYLEQLKVSATKSMHGHLLGGAGAYEAVLTVLALQQQMAPPTINLHDPDPALPAAFNPVAHRPQALKTDYALSNSFGFGGTNASLLFKRAG